MEDITLTVRGRERWFRAVEHEKCPDCGERIFGIDASRAFDRILREGRKRRAAAT